ncbi:MAG: hypothetical protein Tsb002_01480 [Wenzhouxiangellaceae bacterium]
MTNVNKWLILMALSALLSSCAGFFQQYDCHQQAQNRPDAAQKQAECSHPRVRDDLQTERDRQ